MSRGRTIEDSRKDYQTLKARVGSEEINRRAREWRNSNLEKAKITLAKSRKNNPERNLLNKARTNAKRMGLPFNLVIEDIIIPKQCPLLKTTIDAWGHKDVCPSIDRIDSNLGYIKGNIHVISWKANRMKNTATIPELLEFCQNGLVYWKDIVKYD